MTTNQSRNAVAILLTVVLTIGLLYVLDTLSPGLTTEAVLRDTIALIGQEGSQFEAFSGTWLVVRALVGLYITGVTVGLTVLMLLEFRGHAGETAER